MRWDFDLYFLMLGDMKSLFMYLLAICTSSLGKYLFSTSGHLKKLILSNEYICILMPYQICTFQKYFPIL